MDIAWWNWVLIAGGVLVIALLIFTTVYSVKSWRYVKKEEYGERKTKSKKS